MFFQQNKLAIKVFVFHWKVYVLLALFSDKFKCIWLILFNVFFWDLIVFGVNVLEPLYFFWKLHSELSHNLYSPRVTHGMKPEWECGLGKLQSSRSQQSCKLQDYCTLFSEHFLSTMLLPAQTLCAVEHGWVII